VQCIHLNLLIVATTMVLQAGDQKDQDQDQEDQETMDQETMDQEAVYQEADGWRGSRSDGPRDNRSRGSRGDGSRHDRSRGRRSSEASEGVSITTISTLGVTTRVKIGSIANPEQNATTILKARVLAKVTTTCGDDIRRRREARELCQIWIKKLGPELMLSQMLSQMPFPCKSDFLLELQLSRFRAFIRTPNVCIIGSEKRHILV